MVRGRSLVRLAGALAFPVLAIVFAVGFYASVADMGLRSRLFPQLLIAALVPLLALQIVSELRVRDAPGRTPTPGGLWRDWHKSLKIMAATLAFIVLLAVVGFYVAMPVFVLACLLLLDVRRLSTIAITLVAFFAGSHVLFTLVLDVPLP